MANSKANIYPIQLQGAELNLNKYDAEIKQYSGFNKNNSPYVGGGLSPIFTKDEHIEGSTPENTYIDTNGDVYRVDTSGLWKNEEKIYRFEQGSYFIHKKEIKNIPENVIRVFSDKIIMTVDSYNIFYINGKGIGGKVSNSVSSNEEYLRKYFHGFFDTIDGINYFICAFYTGTLHYRVYNADTGELLLAEDSWNGGQQDLGDELWMKTVIMKEKGSRKLQILFETRTLYTQAVRYYTKDNFLSSSGFSATLSNYSVPESNKSGTYEALGGNDCRNYIFLGFPINVAIAKHTVDISNKTIFDHFAINPEVNINFDYNNAKQLSNITSITGSSSNNSLLDSELQESLETKYFTSFIMQFYQGNNIAYIPYKNFCLVNVKNNRVYNPAGYYFIWGHFCLLINNNNLSGISSYFNNTTGRQYKILLTDWNNVDISDVSFINDDKICVKEGNKYYIIYNDNIPELMKKLNQLVINVSSNLNSYDLISHKLLCYAPGFNNSFTIYSANANFNVCITNKTNAFMLASAINEYERDKNSSIILNPINVVNFSINNNTFSFDKLIPAHINFCNVNIYTGESDCIYKTSYIYNFGNNFFINKNLIGLPFPSNTDGNVEYSPSLFSEIKSIYGNIVLIKNGSIFYPLMKGNNNEPVMSFFLASGIDNLQEAFIVQGQHYGILNNGIYAISYDNGVLSGVNFVVDITGLKFCGNTPYQAIFFSETNRCLYSFSGANILNKMQFVDKFSRIDNYIYNPATQTNILFTDIGVIFLSLFGMFLLEVETSGCFLLENGVILYDDNGNYKYIRYYIKESDTDFTKQNIQLETCFYGMNDQTVTINDCLYFRLFSENHESGDIEVSATTLTNTGRKTEKTTFKIKSTDWDNMTHSIYLRYQPKAQRGLGISFSINSPFMIAALSVGSVPDTILVDKISKGAINAPEQTSNNVEW